jgi:hypothetical protein
MKTFLEYLTIRENSSIANKPIIFAGNQGVIIPSEHGGNIKTPNPQELQKIKQIAQKGFWYEGVGEGKQAGAVESAWLKNLGINAKNNGSYDKKINAYKGLGGAATVFSSLHDNLGNFNPLLRNTNLKTAADILMYVLTNGISMEQPISQQEAQQFLDICEQDGLNLKTTAAQDFLEKAKEAEGKMWGGGNPDGSSSNTALGDFAYQVEKARRKEIYDLAKQQGGIFFLGSDHLPAMAQEIGA